MTDRNPLLTLALQALERLADSCDLGRNGSANEEHQLRISLAQRAVAEIRDRMEAKKPLTIRAERSLISRLDREARRRRISSREELVRTLLREGLPPDPC